ncbi:hypothetical protein LSAT2_025372, partial [Lamellibrachia satsuma]
VDVDNIAGRAKCLHPGVAAGEGSPRDSIRQRTKSKPCLIKSHSQKTKVKRGVGKACVEAGSEG